MTRKKHLVVKRPKRNEEIIASIILWVNDEIEREDQFYSYLPHQKIARTLDLVRIELLDKFGEFTQYDEDIVFTTILKIRLGDIKLGENDE